MVRAQRVEVRLLGVALAIIAVAVVFVIGGARTARAAPTTTTLSSTTSSSSTTTTTTKPTTTTAKPTTTTPTTLPPTSLITTPTSVYHPTSTSAASSSSSSSSSTQSVTTYTLPASTVTAPAISNGGTKHTKPKGGSGGLSDATKLWLVVGSLLAVGVLISVLTFLYWRRTRPGVSPTTAPVLSPAALDALVGADPSAPATPATGTPAVTGLAAKPIAGLDALVPPAPKVAPPPGVAGPQSGVRILGPVAAWRGPPRPPCPRTDLRGPTPTRRRPPPRRSWPPILRRRWHRPMGPVRPRATPRPLRRIRWWPPARPSLRRLPEARPPIR